MEEEVCEQAATPAQPRWNAASGPCSCAALLLCFARRGAWAAWRVVSGADAGSRVFSWWWVLIRQFLLALRSQSRALREHKRGSPELDEDWASMDLLTMSYAQYVRLHKRIRKEKKRQRDGDGNDEKSQLQQMLQLLGPGLAGMLPGLA